MEWVQDQAPFSKCSPPNTFLREDWSKRKHSHWNHKGLAISAIDFLLIHQPV
uniref:Uncharacterized protein n=1 Tax=Anguilla anguilla TaxID=7936 RepID=A0A0E9WG88_ANGAN